MPPYAGLPATATAKWPGFPTDYCYTCYAPPVRGGCLQTKYLSMRAPRAGDISPKRHLCCSCSTTEDDRLLRLSGRATHCREDRDGKFAGPQGCRDNVRVQLQGVRRIRQATLRKQGFTVKCRKSLRPWLAAHMAHGPFVDMFCRITEDPSRKNHRWKSLRHNDRTLAEQEAKELAGQLLATGTAPARHTLPLAELFARYEQEKSRFKRGQGLREDQRRMELWQTFLGNDRDVNTLDYATLDRFVAHRRAGRIELAPLPPRPTKSKRKKPRSERRRLAARPSDTTIGADIVFLNAVLNWATTVRLKDWSRLLSENPIRGYPVPRNRRPHRPIATYDRYLKLKAVADQVHPRFGAFLDLVEALGWRVSAIAQLRGEDVDRRKRPAAPHGRIKKRRETDKEGVEMWVPLSPEARTALDHIPVLGGPLFPKARAKDRPWDRWYPTELLRKAEALAGLDHLEHGAWHPFRRKWCIERKHLPIQDVMAAGGWSDVRTVQTVYQQVDDETLLAVVTERRKLREAK